MCYLQVELIIVTLPETNIAREHRPLEKFLLGNTICRGYESLGRVINGKFNLKFAILMSPRKYEAIIIYN